MLEIITFTGVDRRTSMHQLAALAYRHYRAEFGVLVGSNTGHPEMPIFPPIHTVNKLKEAGQASGFRTALHLCGIYSRQVMDPQGPQNSLYELCEGFDRVQINLHADTFGSGDIDVNVRAITRFADAVQCERVIIQHRGPGWSNIPVSHEKIEYLFDLSEGRGMESFENWPEPNEDLARMGYAGGLGPHNIEKALAFAERHYDIPLWFDMEGNIRSDGWFDLSAVRKVCDLAQAI